MTTSLTVKKSMRFPVSGLPTDVYTNRRFDPRWERVYLSDNSSHNVDTLRLEARYTYNPPENPQARDFVKKTHRKLANIGLGMKKRLRRLRNLPAGVVIEERTKLNELPRSTNDRDGFYINTIYYDLMRSRNIENKMQISLYVLKR